MHCLRSLLPRSALHTRVGWPELGQVPRSLALPTRSRMGPGHLRGRDVPPEFVTLDRAILASAEAFSFAAIAPVTVV